MKEMKPLHDKVYVEILPKEEMNDDRYKLTMQEYVLGRKIRDFKIIDDKKIVITLEHYSKLELVIEHKEDGLLFYIDKHMI